MIRTEKTHLKSVARSHAGMSGKNNEDRFGVSAFHLDERSATPVLFAVLADGIGGHRAGEVAAEMVVDIVSKIVSNSNGSDPQGTLRAAIQTASNEVYKLAQAEEGRKGMGATVVCAWVIGKRLYTAYVGDSRLYLIREGQIQRLTRDHSWIQEAIESGILTPEQAEGHPNAHVIRRYVGSPEPPEVDFRLYLDPRESEKEAVQNQGTELKNGDRLLLCSDGLTDLVEDQEILEFVQEQTPEDAVDKLIDLANERGGHDNITIVLVGVPEGVFVEKKPKPQPPAGVPVRTFALGCLGLAVIAALAVGAFLGVRWWNNRSAPAATMTSSATGAPLFVETPSTTAPAGIAVTPLPAVTQSQSSTLDAQSPSGDAGTSEEGNILPPPDPDSMTAVPTNTLQPTLTSTPTLTPTETETASP